MFWLRWRFPPKIYALVCESDGVTYDNDCYAEISILSEWVEGECTEKDIWPNDKGRLPIKIFIPYVIFRPTLGGLFLKL